VLGEHPRTFAKRVTTEPETSRPSARELRRRSNGVRLEAALGGPVDAPAPASDDALRRKAAELGHSAHARQSDFEVVKAHERELMLALLRHP
jgi:hypothetical protein